MNATKKKKYLVPMIIIISVIIIIVGCAIVFLQIIRDSKPFDENAAEAYVKKQFNNRASIELVDHRPDIENGTDYYEFHVVESYPMYDDITIVSLQYAKNGYKWEIDNCERSYKRKFHFNGIYGDYLKFLDCTDDGKVNVAKYTIGLGFDEGTAKRYSGYSIEYRTYEIVSIPYTSKGGYNLLSREYLPAIISIPNQNNDYYFLKFDTSYIAFDKNGMYSTGYFDGMWRVDSVRGKLEKRSEKEFEKTISGFTFFYGVYDPDYCGDVSNTIVVPYDVVGMDVDEATSYLKDLGFGKIAKYYSRPKTVKSVYCIHDFVSYINRRFDKGSWLYLFNHDD